MSSGVIDVVMAGIGPPGPVSGAAGGDLVGAYPNPTLKNDAVTTAKIANAAVTLEKLAFDIATQGELDAVVVALNAALAEKATSVELQAAVTALVDAAPGVLDTLNELAAALGDDPNFATTIMAALALKADSDHDHNGTLVETATLTTDGDLLTRLAGVPAPLSRAALAVDDDFTAAFRQKIAAVSVYRNAVQPIPNSAWTPVQWTTKLFDQTYMHNDVAFTSRLVVPSGFDGLFAVEAQVTFAPSASGTLRLARIVKNNVTVYNADGESFVASRNARVTTAALVDVVAGDYITVEAYQDTGGSLDLEAGIDRNRMAAHWVGKPAQYLIGAPMLTKADTVTDSVFWTRPFENPDSVGSDDKYVWIGSTDHGNGFSYRGLSSAQTVPPSSWVKFLPPEGTGRETPHLIYEPTAAKPWRLYYSGAVVDDGQKTFLASYPTIADMVTNSPNVTAHGIIFPNDAVEGQAFDHTGYAYVERRAADDYHAWSLVQTGSDPKFAHWTSTDGIAWAVTDYPLDKTSMTAAGRELTGAAVNRVTVGGTTYAILMDQPDTTVGGVGAVAGRRVVLCEMPDEATFANLSQLWTPLEHGLVDNLRDVRAVVDETNPQLVHLYIHNDRTNVHYSTLLL